jgi:hypothetical protein
MNGKLKTAVVIAVFAMTGISYGETFIVEHGKPNAEIVIAENAARMAALGALELRYYLEKMTGATLPIVTKPDNRFPVKVYVGESDYLKNLGVTASDLKHEAFRMVTWCPATTGSPSSARTRTSSR